MGTDYFGMSWVLTSPPWLICAGIAIILFATGIVGLTANTRMMKSVIDVSDRDLAKAIIGLLAGLSSLLLALTVSQVRTAFDAAENLVKIEGSQFRQMDMLLDELGADGQTARLLLRDYIRSIVQDEWPALALGSSISAASTRVSWRSSSRSRPASCTTASCGSIMPMARSPPSSSC